MTEPLGTADVPLPWLMRHARDVYREAVVAALAGVGCDDLPRNGTFVLSELERRAGPPEFTPQADINSQR